MPQVEQVLVLTRESGIMTTKEVDSVESGDDESDDDCKSVDLTRGVDEDETEMDEYIKFDAKQLNT